MSRAPFQVLVYPYRPAGAGDFLYAVFKRADHHYWQGVAGGGEEGESPIQAARRETFEETGISPNASFLPLQTVEPIPVTEFKDSQLWGEETYIIPQYCFGVLAPSSELTLSQEHSLYCWLPFAEAFRRLKFEGNRTALWELDRRLRGDGPRGGTLLEQIHTSCLSPIMLKLGGSLITDKTRPHTPRKDALERLSREIATAFAQQPDMKLILGHGSGSFGHVPGKKYNTRQGVHTPDQWRGFAEVWGEARALNQIVTEALQAAGLPVVAFPPSAEVVAQEGQIIFWELAPIAAALEHGLLPVIHGDVVFDTSRGGTILSTEDLFAHLATVLHPQRILLAGLEDGVWADYPACTKLISKITPANLDEFAPALGGSHGADVTGGMEGKVRQALALSQTNSTVTTMIFSGVKPGNITQALLGTTLGTEIGQEQEQN
ncbi:MAG: NUDIX domain-containing protein [Anaerolineales bacterium]|nr:NUDIX domain-containing protein [Anaerolineales bacterium]